MEILVPIIGLFIGYILNNYILTVDEDEKGEFLKPNFDKKRTLIILLWNSLIPLVLFKMYDKTFSVQFFRDVTLSALCSAVFFIDFRLHIIPNFLNLIAFVLGCLYIFVDKKSATDTLIGAIIGLVFFIFIILVSRLILKRDGMGLGDAKFMCVVGIMTGTVYTISIIFLSFIFGSIGALISIMSKNKKMGEEIAFGPYIVIASMVMMFFGYQILGLYLAMM